MCIRRNLLTLPTRVTLTINLKFSPLFFWGEGGAFYVSLLKKLLLSSKQQSNCHSTFYLRKELECRQCSEKRFCILLTICWCVQQTLWEKIKLQCCSFKICSENHINIKIYMYDLSYTKFHLSACGCVRAGSQASPGKPLIEMELIEKAHTSFSHFLKYITQFAQINMFFIKNTC